MTNKAPEMPQSKTRVAFVWDADYPWDVRVEKVTQGLREMGCNVHLICRNTKGWPRFEDNQGLYIHRLPALRALGKMGKSLSFPAFFNPLWLFRIGQVIRSQKCELIVVRDLPLAPAAIAVGKLFKLPVVLDMAECYPEMLRCTWQFEGFKLKNLIVRNPRLADWVENFVISNVDKILVMVEESRDRLLAKRVDGNRLSIVSNTPEIERFSQNDFIRSANDKNNTTLTMVYVGLLNPSRGVDIAIKAVSLLKQKGLGIRLVIAGDGKFRYALETLVEELGVTKEVQFLGWVDNKKVPAIIAEADIGIVPHKICSHWDTTIPNKLFDYLAAGKPVLVSGAAPAARLVRGLGCGEVYGVDMPEYFAEAVERMWSHSERKAMSLSGRRAIEDRYNWRTDCAEMKRAVREVLKERHYGVRNGG